MAGLDPAVLSAALTAVDHLWSLPSRLAETGAHHGYQQITVCLAGRVEIPALADLLAPFAPVRSAWLSRLAPGGYIREHIDAGGLNPSTMAKRDVSADEVAARLEAHRVDPQFPGEFP